MSRAAMGNLWVAKQFHVLRTTSTQHHGRIAMAGKVV